MKSPADSLLRSFRAGDSEHGRAMARSETTIISLEEAGRRFEEWRHNRAAGRAGYRLSFARLLSRWPGKKGLIDPPGVACGLGRSEAAGGDLGRGSAATGFAGVWGTGRTAGAIGPIYGKGFKASPLKR